MKLEDRQNALSQLFDELRSDTFLPGEGATSAELMLVSHQPEPDDFMAGSYFSGRVGAYVDHLLESINLRRSDVYITALQKHKVAIPHESDILMQEINIIDPLAVVLFGRATLEALFPDKQLSQHHGEALRQDDYTFVPMFHPSAVLRNPKLKLIMEEDFKPLFDLLLQMRRSTIIDDDLNNAQQMSLF